MYPATRILMTPDQLAALPTADGEIVPYKSVRDVEGPDGGISAYKLIKFADKTDGATTIDPNDRDILTNNQTWQQGL